MRGKLIILASATLLLGTGILHGYITNRWGSSAPLQHAIDRLDRLPLNVGNWEGSLRKLDTEQQTIRTSGAFVLARYVNHDTGQALQITLVCGRPGTLSLHPPTICFPSHGYEEKDRPRKLAVSLKDSGQKTEWIAADFTRPVAGGDEWTHILWCYGVDGDWIAPDNPRISLAIRQTVYKLYVARVGFGEEPTGQNDPSVAFLNVFLPELQKALFAP
jgi:hypothetical protein